MAIETVRIASPDPTIPMFMDWRLRECDYGETTDIAPELLERAEYIDVPYPAGESWRQAVEGGRVLSIRVLARPCGSRSWTPAGGPWFLLLR